jgi:protein-disulfide isomerase
MILMKPTYLLAAVAAVFASAACNAEKSDNSGSAASLEAKAVKPPKGGDWATTVAATPAGGFVMGNPDAAVKLIEYGSMTCPHCREFDETGVQPLIDKYVKSGRVSYEFRNYVRDPYDLAGSLIARCNGAQGFFPLTRAMYKDQPNWLARLQTVPQAQMQSLMTMGPERQFLETAKLAGFQQWAAMRGLPTAKSTACLTDQAEINRLVQMNSDATNEHPDFAGTPTFVVNGEVVKGATWKILEPALRDALGD